MTREEHAQRAAEFRALMQNKIRWEIATVCGILVLAVVVGRLLGPEPERAVSLTFAVVLLVLTGAVFFAFMRTNHRLARQLGVACPGCRWPVASKADVATGRCRSCGKGLWTE